MVLVNGEIRDHIDIADRGFQYGDGLFETIVVANGQLVFWDQHYQRLRSGCLRLNIPLPDAQLLSHEAIELCRQADKAVVKIIITRGSGGRGYRQPESIIPTRVLSLHPFPDYPDTYKTDGITARFCTTRLGLNPSLAGIKHLNRLEQVLARAEWNDPAIQEGIMLDSNDHVIEGTMTNLFYVKNDTLYTSAITHAGIAGVMRRIILNLSSQLNQPGIEYSYCKNELLSADEVFVCNSVIGIWPVSRIADIHYRVGPKTGQIQQWLNSYSDAAL